MQTFKFKITRTSDFDTLKECCKQSTGVMYKLYNNAELLSDKGFKNEVIASNSLIDISMFDMIAEDAKTKRKQTATIKSNKVAELKQISKLLKDETLSKRKRYALTNKQSIIKRDIDKDCCFGGKALLRSLTKHAQIAKNISGKLTADEVKINKDFYERELAEFRAKRSTGIYLVGRANEKGNRKVDFDLNNGRVVFKPNAATHIDIYFKPEKRKDILAKLQELSNNKQIPLTLRITETHLCISFDESIVSGYNFGETEYWRKIEKQKISSKEGRTSLAREFNKKLEAKKLVGKMAGRYAAIDQNPYEIALVIADKNEEDSNTPTFIFKQVFDLTKLTSNTGHASHDAAQKAYNNKRKYELQNIWKQIFIICLHYKVYNFVIEDLNCKQIQKDEKTAEFNRQTKNVWHRELSKKLILKWVNVLGIKLIEVNPAYSSFIGNMVHDMEYDPIAAAMELLRRGIVKFIKGSSLYPELRLINRQKLTYLGGENDSFQSYTSWVDLYKQLTRAKSRYRNRNKEVYLREGIHFNSHKSNVKTHFSKCA